MSYAMPYPLLLAIRAMQDKPTHFYGTPTDLTKARKHAKAKSAQRFAVLRLLKRMEGR